MYCQCRLAAFPISSRLSVYQYTIRCKPACLKMKTCLLLSTAATMIALSMSASLADTTDVKWQRKVVIEKTGAHCVDDTNCFNRYHGAIPPVARANPGDMNVFHTRDVLDADLRLESVADDLAAIDLNLVHPMTGPVHIEEAKRGDASPSPWWTSNRTNMATHGHQARLWVPARYLYRAASGQLEIVSHPC